MRTLADVFVGKSNNLTFIRLIAALSVIYGHTSAVVAGVLADWPFLGFSGTQNCLTASAIALVCGIASWHLIEKRALRLKKVFFRKTETSTINSGLAPQGASI